MPSQLFENKKSAVTFPEVFTRQVQVCSVWLREGVYNPYTAYRTILSQFCEDIKIPVNRLDMDKTVLLSLEGGSAFERDLSRLYSIKNDGISSVMLSWNNDNSLAGGAHGISGLTKKGIDTIRIMNELCMALDVSHLNDKSFYAAIDRADAVLASHSNARAICFHKRNLTDDALRLIRDKKGIVGINFYPTFLGNGDVFENIYLHIEHMLDLGLGNSVAIGSDLDGADMDERLRETKDIAKLYDFLSERIGDSDICDKIFFKNAYNFYEKLFDKQSNML